MNNNLISPLWAVLPNYASRVFSAHEKQLGFYAKQNPDEIKDKFNCNIDINDLAKVPEDFTILSNGVATLPVTGMVIPKSDFFTLFFGGFAALDILERDFKTLLSRSDVKSIVLDIDSPGGNAFGVEQFANLIFESRNIKPIVAITSGMMASAAMWIGAAAEKVFITGEVTVTGSIGTVTTHTDISGLNKMIGITQTEVAAGEFKRIPSSLAPLDKKGREVLQSQVNQANNAFLNGIAKFKNVKLSAVKKMAEGKTFIGSQGVKVGLIDGLLSMGQLLDNISDGIDSVSTVTSDNFNKFNKFNNLNGGQKMTLIEQIAQMKTENSDLYSAMIEKGKVEAKAELDESLSDVKAAEHAKGVEAGKVVGRDEGILAERSRISDLQALSNPSCKEMIDGFIADGETTAPEAAVEILKAQSASNKSKLDQLAGDAPNPIAAETGKEGNAGDPKKGLKALVADYMAEHNCSKGKAITECSKAYPDAENDFIEVVKRKQY